LRIADQRRGLSSEITSRPKRARTALTLGEESRRLHADPWNRARVGATPPYPAPARPGRRRDAEPVGGELRADARAKQRIIEVLRQPELLPCAIRRVRELENQPETAAVLLLQEMGSIPARVGI